MNIEYCTLIGNAEKNGKSWRWGRNLDIKFEVSEGQVGESAHLWDQLMSLELRSSSTKTWVEVPSWKSLK